MKKFIFKYSGILTAFALIIASHSANAACFYHFNQPEQPDAVKKLRKF